MFFSTRRIQFLSNTFDFDLTRTICSKMTSSSNSNTALVLFRNDLRLHDNEAIYLANRNHRHVIPLYCFDPRHFATTYHFGFPKTGRHRAKFLLECVADLKSNLQSKGSDLVVRIGKPEDIIPELMKSLDLRNKTTVILQKEVTDEEIRVEEALQSSPALKIETVWGHSLHHIDDLPFQPKRLPDIYTQYRKSVEDNTPVRKCFQLPDALKPLVPNVDTGAIPSLKDLGHSETESHPKSVFPFHGGETAALQRQDHYLWQSDHVATYKETRNGMIGEDYSTKFSPWLAHGCISPRQIYWEIKKYEKERTANQSTYWVIFELLWRDYFRFVALKYGNKIFFPSGIKGDHVNWKNNKLHFKAWQEGSTGVPYIDANMREMEATGFMSNRGRQIDHDVCSNYGNWLYSAGIGNDPRENRKFNVVKQGLDYDADGEYVRTWVPELSRVRGGQVHCVWTMSQMALDTAGVSLRETYPHPIVVAPEWSRHVNRPGSSRSDTSRGRGQGKGKGQGRGQGSARGHGNQSVSQKRGIDFYFKNSNVR